MALSGTGYSLISIALGSSHYSLTVFIATLDRLNALSNLAPRRPKNSLEGFRVNKSIEPEGKLEDSWKSHDPAGGTSAVSSYIEGVNLF